MSGFRLLRAVVAAAALLASRSANAEVAVGAAVAKNNGSLAMMFAANGAASTAYAGAYSFGGGGLFASSYDMASSLIMTQSFQAFQFAQDGLRAWHEEQVAKLAKEVASVGVAAVQMAEAGSRAVLDAARALIGAAPAPRVEPPPPNTRSIMPPGVAPQERAAAAEAGARIVGTAPSGDGPAHPGQTTGIDSARTAVRGLRTAGNGSRLFDNTVTDGTNDVPANPLPTASPTGR